MFSARVFLLVAAAATASASVLAERVDASNNIAARAVIQGWSLQASTCPTDSKSCGSGYCCPSSLSCNPAGNREVAACCTSGDCRGAVEGSPVCADSTWSLWTGLDGNGFCCQSGQVGIYDYRLPGAGSCVASAPADATKAVLKSPGSGAAATAVASTSTAAAAPATTAAPVVPVASTTAVVVVPAATPSATVAAGASAATSAAAAPAPASTVVAAVNGTTSAGAAAATTTRPSSADRVSATVGMLVFAGVVAMAL